MVFGFWTEEDLKLGSDSHIRHKANKNQDVEFEPRGKVQVEAPPVRPMKGKGRECAGGFRFSYANNVTLGTFNMEPSGRQQ